METLAGIVRAQSEVCQIWAPPGRGIRIELSRNAADQIIKDGLHGLGMIPRRGVEVGGFLVGSVEHAGDLVVRIEAAVPVACEYLFGPSYMLSEKDKEGLRRALSDAEPQGDGGPQPVGFYRTHTGGHLALTSEDLKLLAEFFPSPDAVALLVKPRAMRSSVGGFFFREDGEIHAESSYEEFALHSRPGRKQDRTEPQPVQTRKGRVGDLPSLLASPGGAEQRRRAHRIPHWFSLWVQTPIFVVLLFAYALMGYLAAPRLKSQAPEPKAPSDPYALSLVVIEYGENLLLSWDRNALAIGKADRGVLSITDGTHRRSVELSAAQLRNENVTYLRLSPMVDFRLEVFLKARRSVSETIQVRAGASAASASRSR